MTGAFKAKFSWKQVKKKWCKAVCVLIPFSISLTLAGVLAL
jgi:hypothetical protein